MRGEVAPAVSRVSQIVVAFFFNTWTVRTAAFHAVLFYVWTSISALFSTVRTVRTVPRSVRTLVS